MSRVSRWTAASRRVYTILVILLVLAAVAVVRAQAPVDLTVEPFMVRGPAGAPVTIIEFSDYQ